MNQRRNSVDVQKQKRKLTESKNATFRKLHHAEQSCDEDEYVVIQNPDSRRIQHVMKHDDLLHSLCNGFKIQLLGPDLDPFLEIKSEEQIRDEIATCKNCKRQMLTEEEDWQIIELPEDNDD